MQTEQTLFVQPNAGNLNVVEDLRHGIGRYGFFHKK